MNLPDLTESLIVKNSIDFIELKKSIQQSKQFEIKQPFYID